MLKRLAPLGLLLVLAACDAPAPDAAAPPLADAPPAAGKCVGWQRSLTTGADFQKSWEVERCLRALAVKDRAAAVAEARVLVAWAVPVEKEPRLATLAAALTQFPVEADLIAYLQRLGVLSDAPPAEDSDMPPPLAVADYLEQRGRAYGFDTETGVFPNFHDELLDDLAALAGPPLAEATFTEVPPADPDDDSAPYLLRAKLGGRDYEIPARNLGDWYDLDAVLKLLHTLAVDAGMETRFYTLPTGDQTAVVWAANPKAAAELVGKGLLVLQNPDGSMVAGKAFEQEVLKGLKQEGAR